MAASVRSTHATTWTAASGDWSIPENWSAGVPSADVDAVFDRSGAYVVTLASASTARDLAVLAGPLTLETAGRTLSVRDLSLGAGASFVLSGGGLLSTGVPAGRGYDLVGSGAGGAATLTVTGVGTRYTAAGGVQLGTAGATGVGRLVVGSGASVTVGQTLKIYGNAGDLTVAGGTFTPLRKAEQSGNGSPLIPLNGYRFQASGPVGRSDRPTGPLTDGATSAFGGNATDVCVGYAGAKGALSLSGVGTSATLGNGRLLYVGGGGMIGNGTYAAGDGAVSVPGGAQLTTARLAVGHKGVGVMTIDGGTPAAASTVVANGYANDYVVIGGDGTLNITNGGQVTTAGNVSVGRNGATGRLLVEGTATDGSASRLSTAGVLGVGTANAATPRPTDGTVTVRNGGQLLIGPTAATNIARLTLGVIGTGRFVVDGAASKVATNGAPLLLNVGQTDGSGRLRCGHAHRRRANDDGDHIPGQRCLSGRGHCRDGRHLDRRRRGHEVHGHRWPVGRHWRA